ncbi:MAG: hypothetical protein V2A66_00460, partial [Pseudomonadota bacterium]
MRKWFMVAVFVVFAHLAAVVPAWAGSGLEVSAIKFSAKSAPDVERKPPVYAPGESLLLSLDLKGCRIVKDEASLQAD